LVSRREFATLDFVRVRVGVGQLNTSCGLSIKIMLFDEAIFVGSTDTLNAL
jgi:hypothetical protein